MDTELHEHLMRTTVDVFKRETDKLKAEIAELLRRLDNRQKREAQLTEALHQIASASPCVSLPGTEHERACVFCRTLIDVARDALGRERWPAESVRP
jgi:DNA gyrase/topoisomerase IV subunit A